MSILEQAAERRAKEEQIAPEPRHDGYVPVEPMRPDLKPGESITYVPDRYCVKCQQARGIRRCPICGSETVLREDLGQVVLPELPPGAALNVELKTQIDAPALPSSSSATPATNRQVLDATPPPDPEIEQLLEHDPHDPRFTPRETVVQDVRIGARSSMLDRALREREEAAKSEAVVIEQATTRSRLLDRAAEQAAAAAAPQPMPAFLRRESSRPALLDLSTRRTNGSRLVASGRSAMQTTSRERVLDEGGREVQRTPGKGSRRKTPEDELLTLWENARIDKSHWVKFAAAYAQSGMDPEAAADAADALYMQLITRENLATSR